MNGPSELRYFIAQSMLVLMLKEAGEKQTARKLAKELVSDWRKAHGGEPVKSRKVTQISPSPSVGTPEMTSANRAGEA